MKTLVYFLCLITFVACTGRQKSAALNTPATNNVVKDYPADSIRRADSLQVIAAKKAFKPYKLNEDYTALDTGYYGCGSLEGYYAIVERNGKLADTIHLGMGIQEISKDHYLYLKIGKCGWDNGTYPGTANMRADQYFTVLNGRKIPLTHLVKDFVLYRSLPNAINGKIYFCQYSAQKGGIFEVKAAEYDPKTGKTRSQFLATDKLKDEHASFWSHKEKDNIVFYGPNRSKWTFSPDFKLLNNVQHK